MNGAPAKPISAVSPKPSATRPARMRRTVSITGCGLLDQPRGIQRGDARRIAQPRQDRPLAFLEFQAVTQRPGQDQDVAEQDRRIEAVAADRLQRDLGGQVRRGA